MDRFEGLLLSREQTLEMHEAARIAGNEVFGCRIASGGAFHLAHGGGDHGEFRGEGAAEAAAGLRFLHLDELEAAHLFEKLAGGLFEVQLPQAVAAVVVGDLVREGRTEIGDAEFVHEEVGELPALVGESIGLRFLGLAVKEFLVKDLQHRAAGAGGDDDGVAVTQSLQHGAGGL